MIGQTFNYLTVLFKDLPRPQTKSCFYTCRCICGTIKSIRKDNIIEGKTKSCGCKKIELKRKSQLLPINEEFFLNDNPIRSYFLGLFLTDGYISKNKQMGIQLQEKDKHILEILSHIICPLNKLQFIDKNKRKDNFINRQNQYRLVFSNDNVYTLMRNWGFDNNKTITAVVPKELKFDSHFWRGCIDGDGTICLTNKTIIVELIGTPTVVNSFKDYCNFIGLDIKRSILKPKKYSIDIRTFRVQGKNATKLLAKLYENKEEFFIERKYNKYLQWLEHKQIH